MGPPDDFRGVAERSAAAIATVAQIVRSRSTEVVESAKVHLDTLCLEFTDQAGGLVLPHAALPAHGRA
ncbi:hypothetical protein BCL76_11655 [Streptomyces sp. CG 926]|uniref:hypothetical protein n=1 Tax=Streptomyces sp. CG 926 TaxID=1882405 RepID=UPI000D7A155E|nr:hypothetical protein [Streptomyces sp. CG 926]PWK64193.1 hypothetical protein BCL76_11655 [Streptomyces sp. CG 926]